MAHSVICRSFRLPRLIPIISAFTLAACGGQGNDPVPAGNQRINGIALPQCTPQSDIRIQLFGDSTQELQGTEIQQWMDGRFGRGVVTVTNHGRSGSTSVDFPASVVQPGALTVVSYGINDSRMPNATVNAYQARMAAIAPTMFQTPSPTYDSYAAAMRQVATQLNRPVIDVSREFRLQPNWQSQVPDTVHSNWSALLWIAYQVVGPALAEQVDQRLCTAQLDAAGRTLGPQLRVSTPSLIVWGQKGSVPASAKLTYTNGGAQPAQATFSGLTSPYRLSQNTCNAPAFGGTCTVDIQLDSDGPLGGQGTQWLQATAAGSPVVTTVVWGMLVPP